MSKFTLNEDQEMVVSKAVDWFNNSSDEVFQFDGEAGTGKSVVLNEILERLDLEDDEYACMAYTGQASMVMKTKGLKNVATCHSTLFYTIEVDMYDNNGNLMLDPKFHKPLKKLVLKPKSFVDSPIKLFIIDEAWMVPKSFRKYIDDTGIRVIAAGDSAQLPPIEGEPAYLATGKIYHLTQLMRQAADSPLIYLAHRAKNGYPIDYGLYGEDVLVIGEDEINDEMLKSSDIILTATNKTRDEINKYYRKNILGFKERSLMYQDKIICRKNYWETMDKEYKYSLVNGLTGRVAEAPTAEDFDSKYRTLRIKFDPDLIDCTFDNIELNYDYLFASKLEKDKMKLSKYTHGMFFEFAYASTVHLAQGSEYKQGMIFDEFYRADTRRSIVYTAITRFKKRLIYVKQNKMYY